MVHTFSTGMKFPEANIPVLRATRKLTLPAGIRASNSGWLTLPAIIRSAGPGPSAKTLPGVESGRGSTAVVDDLNARAKVKVALAMFAMMFCEVPEAVAQSQLTRRETVRALEGPETAMLA